VRFSRYFVNFVCSFVGLAGLVAAQGNGCAESLGDSVSGLSFRSTPDRLQIPVTRVVSSGLPESFQSNGTLVASTSLQNSAIISANAYLKVSFQLAIDPAYHAYASGLGLSMTITRQVRIRFNGAYVGYTYLLAATARPDRWAADRRSVCIPVPTRMIRFAKLRKRLNPTSYADNSLGGKTPLPSPATIFPCTNAPSDPEAPCPGLNDVQVVWTGGDALYGINHVLNQVGPLKLESAMEPIVLVGGCCGEYGNFWNSGELRSGFYSFEQRMKEIGAPYAHLAYGEAIFSEVQNGAGFLLRHLKAIAKAYGSPWLHLVAHSKGGLNARYMLLNNSKALVEDNVGILSVTFLQTPI
jgi:hypothetical protein